LLDLMALSSNLLDHIKMAHELEKLVIAPEKMCFELRKRLAEHPIIEAPDPSPEEESAECHEYRVDYI